MRATFHSSIEEIDASEWDALDHGGDPFISHIFLTAAERHGAVSGDLGWHPRHLALRDDAGMVCGAVPLYLRSHSFGDFSGDWNWASAFERSGVGYYPKLVSGIPYTPATGPRFLVRRGMARAPVVAHLIASALGGVRELNCSSWQCLFVEESLTEQLSRSGFLLRRGYQFHWQNRGYGDFEDFLAAFTADKRKKVRRERRRVAESGLSLEVRHGDEIDAELWRCIYPHYRSTFMRYGNHPAFSSGFFADVARRLGKRLVVFLARAGERVIAAAICYRSATSLYGRHWGAEAEYHSLHFELCFYQGIEYCINEGLACFEPGAQGEHKVSRGFSPVSTWSAYWIANPRMRQVIAEYLQREHYAVANYQDEMAEHQPYKRVSSDATGV